MLTFRGNVSCSNDGISCLPVLCSKTWSSFVWTRGIRGRPWIWSYLRPMWFPPRHPPPQIWTRITRRDQSVQSHKVKINLARPARERTPGPFLHLLVVVQAHLYVSDKNLYALTGNINSSMNICISAMGVWAPCSCSGQIVTSVWQLRLYLGVLPMTIKADFINSCRLCASYQNRMTILTRPHASLSKKKWVLVYCNLKSVKLYNTDVFKSQQMLVKQIDPCTSVFEDTGTVCNNGADTVSDCRNVKMPWILQDPGWEWTHIMTLLYPPYNLIIWQFKPPNSGNRKKKFI